MLHTANCTSFFPPSYVPFMLVNLYVAHTSYTVVLNYFSFLVSNLTKILRNVPLLCCAELCLPSMDNTRLKKKET
jgi:hypothetical protein